MKRTFIFLLLALAVLFVKEGYEIITANGKPIPLLTGKLSDIAGEVVAIPLKGTEAYNIRQARHVRRVGESLFLVCNDAIYRFNKNGELIGRVTDPEMIKVGGYIVDAAGRRLIVMGNADDVYYYTFDGELVITRKLKSDFSNQQVHTAVFHDDCIWTVEEHLKTDPDTQQVKVEQEVVMYDKAFNRIESRPIRMVPLGRKQGLPAYHRAELVVQEDTGRIYVYSPSFEPEELLRDSLYLLKNSQRRVPEDDFAYLYPVRMGRRFWISSYHGVGDDPWNHLFCYDTGKNRSWQLRDGLEDNFYHTGVVKDLKPVDLYGRNYYYIKSGEALRQSFPDVAADSLVLFVVQIKT